MADDDFKRFGADLKKADKVIKAKVTKAIRETAKPVAINVIREGAQKVPSRGGLRAIVEQAAPTVTVNSNGVVINMLNKRRTNLSALDKGYIRHPVFAKKALAREDWKWVKQMTPQTKNAFTDAFNRLAAPTIAPELSKAINAAIDEINEGVH